MKYKKYNTIIKIEWVDSGYEAGWNTREHSEEMISSKGYHEDCQSAGIYIGENKELFFICLSISEINVCDIMYIPKCAITKIKIIGELNNEINKTKNK